MNRINRLRVHQIYLLMFPGLIVFTMVMVIPMGMATYLSFFSTKGIRLQQFVGLRNYAMLLADKQFFAALSNNLYIIALCIVGQVGVGLGAALLICLKPLNFKLFHRNAAFVPVVLSPVVVGMIWSILYKSDGLVNGALTSLGLGGWIRHWLDDPSIVMTYVTLPLIWWCVGLFAVIFMAALSSLPEDCMESAEIDGANGLKKLWYITLPLIRNTIFICVTLAVAGNMKIFDHIFVMTKGGPGRASMVLALYAYQNMFKLNKMDYGCTVSVGIMVISLLLILIVKRVLRGESDA